MSLLSKLERRFGRFAVPNVTLGLIVCQVIVFVMAQGQRNAVPGESLEQRLVLVPERVLAGEVWRLATFLIVPPGGNIIFACFFWYFFGSSGNRAQKALKTWTWLPLLELRKQAP